jgi:uncharacterized membrane protein YkgB
MDTLFRLIERLAAPPRLLRLSLGLVLLWIAALKFADPSPVVGLLRASFPLLASSAFVYLLGVLELGVAGLLLTGRALRYAGSGLLGLFAGTLAIFVVAPRVTYGPSGFPFLSLAGQFLLKDLVLFAAAATVIALAPAPTPVPEPAPGRPVGPA